MPDSDKPIPPGLGRVRVRAVGALGERADVWCGVYDATGQAVRGCYGGELEVDVPPGAYRVEIHHPQHDVFEVGVGVGQQLERRSLPRGRIQVRGIDALGAPADVWVGVLGPSGSTLSGAYGGRVSADVLPGTYVAQASFDPVHRRQVSIDAGAQREERLGPWRVTRIELELPGHELIGDTFRVVADPPDGPDVRPRARFRVTAWATGPEQGEQPAPDGTSLRIGVRSEGDVESRATVSVRGHPVGDTATTLDGGVDGEIRCGPARVGGAELRAAPARRWRLHSDATSTDLEYVDAARFVLEVSARDGTHATSQRFEIEPGRAALLELALPSVLPPGLLPEGIPDVGGDVLEVHDVRHDEKRLSLVPLPALARISRGPIAFRVGGWLRSPARRASQDVVALDVARADGTDLSPLPGGIHMLLGLVTDAASNPVPIAVQGVDEGTRVVLGFPRWQSWLEATRPFALGDPIDAARDPADSVWRCNAQHPLPDNVFYVQVAPAFGTSVAETDLQLRIADGDTVFGEWTYRFVDRPTSALDRAVYWFAAGDPQDGWQYLGELVLGVIPLLGDGRDLLIYGMKRIQGDSLSVLDHAAALLALAGLALDLIPASPMNAAAASAKASVKLLKRIPTEPAQALALAIREQLRRSLPSTDGVQDWKKLVDDVDFKKLSASIDELAELGRAVERVLALEDGVQKARKLLTALGLAVAAVQLGPLIQLAASFTYDEVLDVLSGLEELEKP